MSIKSGLLAAAAVLTLAGGLSAGTVSASAATPQCGNACVEVYSAKFATPASLGFVETVFLGIPLRGVPTIVQKASRWNPAEDSSSRSAARCTCPSSTQTAWCRPR